jgi:hypothetical protein
MFEWYSKRAKTDTSPSKKYTPSYLQKVEANNEILNFSP